MSLGNPGSYRSGPSLFWEPYEVGDASGAVGTSVRRRGLLFCAYAYLAVLLLEISTDNF